jgi:hypothetical protein
MIEKLVAAHDAGQLNLYGAVVALDGAAPSPPISRRRASDARQTIPT